MLFPFWLGQRQQGVRPLYPRFFCTAVTRRPVISRPLQFCKVAVQACLFRSFSSAAIMCPRSATQSRPTPTNTPLQSFEPLRSLTMNLQKTLIAAALTLSFNAAFAAGSPGVEQDTQAFLNALEAGGGKPLEQMTPKDARAVLTGAQASVKFDFSDTQVEDKVINADGQTIKLTIVRPAGATGTLPVFMFFHGGGWVLGDYPTHARLIHDLVVNSGAVAVYVNYTPSPEAHYPTAINQAYAATQWVAEHGKEINVDGKRLAVAGNSVGGNMAAVVSLMAKDKGTPAIRYQVLLWPVTDANFDTGSYEQFAEGHFL